MNRGTHFARLPGSGAACNSWAIGPASPDLTAVTCEWCLRTARAQEASRRAMAADQEAGVWCGCNLVTLGKAASHRVHLPTLTYPGSSAGRAYSPCGSPLRLRPWWDRSGWGAEPSHFTTNPARITCLHCLNRLPGVVGELRHRWSMLNPLSTTVPDGGHLLEWCMSKPVSEVVTAA